jgi:hypothetical protein
MAFVQAKRSFCPPTWSLLSTRIFPRLRKRRVRAPIQRRSRLHGTESYQISDWKYCFRFLILRRPELWRGTAKKTTPQQSPSSYYREDYKTSMVERAPRLVTSLQFHGSPSGESEQCLSVQTNDTGAALFGQADHMFSAAGAIAGFAVP